MTPLSFLDVTVMYHAATQRSLDITPTVPVEAYSRSSKKKTVSVQYACSNVFNEAAEFIMFLLI